MNWLKKLQEKRKANKIDDAAYQAKLKEYLEDEMISQDEYDSAVDYDPDNDSGDDKLYTQEDLDRMALNVASRKVRQAFKDAGITLDVPNKKVIEHVVELFTSKDKDAEGKLSEQEIAQLKKDADKGKTLAGKLQDLSLENAVLRGSGKVRPINPTQVVRALRDYQDEIDFDENGLPEKSSLDLVLRKLSKDEPNLFEKIEKADPGEEGEEQKQETTPRQVPGRTPGGSAKSGSAANDKTKQSQKVKEALERMGVTQEKQA